ncbi:ABC transporter ATP-binding protein [Corynebacterium kutscheri]|uniref:ABC transporter ATP-binding protein n=1 Tax=Corynebacterium kutscheri TaxID=35755 RepID=A0A0F6TDY8_9CORY|nr:ABC transporter ATP-binding protein [Corynebacterium kutscheri]AKE42079.1 ABC-type multidrug transport system, ATPase component [Corynebacterium kutscheri]VEH06029.1 ABC transporter ATP-binding protein [Corynebacterium kutscheri]VEH10421.1 ABC transporter ATP-binding protein [Corynebacterium kutscheri]VEH81936.1 ABC transporter ATP-binding protein [Corynebacterium kutscheri]
MNVVTLTSVTKTYGKTDVVSDLSLNIPHGAVYGFIGPNGAGKSTTMKMLLGLIAPSSGSISLFGEQLTKTNRGKFVAAIGSMIEEPSGYAHLTAVENLKVVQSLLGFADENIDWALDIVGLNEARNKKVKAFSLGMKQRLGIALAICRKPSLLVLDEPTNGLDPYGIEEIRQLIVRLATQEEVTVMVSSHVLAELEKIASHLAIINKGKLVFEGARDELIAQHSPAVLIRTHDIEQALSAIPHSTPIHGGIEVAQVTDAEIPALCQALIDARIGFYEVSRPHQSLESIFMEMTKE